MRLENVTKYDVLDKATSDEAANAVLEMFKNSGASITYRTLNTTTNTYSASYTLNVEVALDDEPQMSNVEAKSKGTVLCSAKQMKDLNITPSKKDGITFDSRKFRITKIVYYNVNAVVTVSLNKSIFVELHVVEEAGLTRTSVVR